MLLYLLLTIPCFVNGQASSLIPASPCKITDTVCIENTANTLLPLVMAGNPELGIESSDPLFEEKNEANLPMIKCTLYNLTVNGFKDCLVSNLILSEDLTKVHADLNCPKFTMDGQYDVSGQLIVLPVQGSGDFSLSTGKYIITVDSELKIVQGKDGKRYFAIKNFKLKCNPVEPMYFEFSNLFDGQKDLSDAVHNFAHENWKEVANLIQDPIWYGHMKKLFSNVNKYLKLIAVENFISQ